MKKILLNGVDGNFGSRSARVLLEKYPHEALIFTAPTKNGLEKYQAMGIETRIADFNNAEKLTEAFKDADTVILISMPFVGPKRRAAHKIAIDAAVAAGVNKLVYTSIVGAGHEDINAYEVNDHVWTERYIKKQPIHYLILRDSQYAEWSPHLWKQLKIQTASSAITWEMGKWHLFRGMTVRLRRPVRQCLIGKIELLI